MTSNNSIPPWVEEKLFDKVLYETVGDFKKIQSFKVFNALKPGENYATVMLRVQIEVLLKDDSSKVQTFMLKVAHNTELHREQLSQWDMFVKEAGMYREVVPEFEQLYHEKGVEIRFGAKGYELPIKEEYILLEDLGTKGFRNAKRQECLDMAHCKSVLQKLAQWHAASAVRVNQKGMYPEKYLHGFFTPTPKGKESCEALFANCFKYIVKAAKKFPNNHEYIQKLESAYSCMLDTAYEQCKVDTKEFNVLNHGDSWCNNIMFQYNEEGKLKDTYLVDLQMPRYGSPAQDLWYFILSSSKLELKMDHFDEMIRYYHDKLIQYLNILDYQEPSPSLKDIHCSLLKHSVWAPLTISSVMAGVLCDPTDDASIDNFVGEDKEDNSFLEKLFFNDRYSEHAMKILPWLYNKGVFDS